MKTAVSVPDDLFAQVDRIGQADAGAFTTAAARRTLGSTEW